MHPAFKVGVGIAAVLIIAVIGWNLLPATAGGIGGPGPTASPTTSPSPTPSTSSPSTALCRTSDSACIGALEPGTHMTSALITPVTYTVPAGWSKPLDAPGAVNLGPTDSTGFIGIWPDWNVAAQDNCDTVSSAEPGWGRTVEDLVRSLTERTGLIVTAPTSVRLGGLDGQVLDVEKDPDFEGACGGGTTVNLFTHTGTLNDVGGLIAIEGERMRLYFLDAGNDRVINVAIVATAAVFDATVDVMTPVIDSMTFE